MGFDLDRPTVNVPSISNITTPMGGHQICTPGEDRGSGISDATMHPSVLVCPQGYWLRAQGLGTLDGLARLNGFAPAIGRAAYDEALVNQAGGRNAAEAN